MIEVADGYVLSTGRSIYANNGILGMGPDLDIFEGYDGAPDPESLYSGEDPWTPEERAEVANMMIDRWQRWSDIKPEKNHGRSPEDRTRHVAQHTEE